MEKLDVVYLEPDLGGLFGAVALAAGGLKVLILEKNKLKARAENKLDGVDFTREPFFLRGLRARGFLEPLFNKLKLLNRVREKVETIDPPMQVITPEARVEIRLKKEDLASEFSREFGAASKKALRLFKTFEDMAGEAYKLMDDDTFPSIPLSLTDRLFGRGGQTVDVEPLRSPPLASLLDELGLESPFTTFLYTLLAVFGNPGGPDVPAYSAAITIDSMRRGLYRADVDTLEEVLLKTFEKWDGYIMASSELEKAEISGREISTLSLSKANYLRSRLFVGSAIKWAEYLPGEFKEAILPAGRPSLHRLEVAMESGAVPVGMKDRVAVLTKSSNVVSPEEVLRISVSQPVKKDGDELRVVTAESIRTGTADVREKLGEYIKKIIPFMDEYERSIRYSVVKMAGGFDTGRKFLELPPMGAINNLLPNENELLAEMGLGQGIVSGRILARLILRKLGLRAKL